MPNIHFAQLSAVLLSGFEIAWRSLSNLAAYSQQLLQAVYLRDRKTSGKDDTDAHMSTLQLRAVATTCLGCHGATKSPPQTLGNRRWPGAEPLGLWTQLRPRESVRETTVRMFLIEHHSQVLFRLCGIGLRASDVAGVALHAGRQ